MDDDQSGRPELPLDLDAVVGDDPLRILERIVSAVHAAGSDDEVMMVGVGPLESLLHQAHGEMLWPEIERLARSDPLFRLALRQVWAYDSPEYERREALLAEFPDDEQSDR